MANSTFVRGIGSLSDVQRLIQRLDAQWEARFRVVGGFARTPPGAARAVGAARIGSALWRAGCARGCSPRPAGRRRGTATPAHHSAARRAAPGAISCPVRRKRYLIERCELAYAPSATVLALLAHRPPRAMGRALVMGVPDPSIPAVTAEVKQVAEALGARRPCASAKKPPAAALRADAHPVRAPAPGVSRPVPQRQPDLLGAQAPRRLAHRRRCAGVEPRRSAGCSERLRVGTQPGAGRRRDPGLHACLPRRGGAHRSWSAYGWRRMSPRPALMHRSTPG